MFTSRGAARAGAVGLPVDGVEMKLVPARDKLESALPRPEHHARLLAPAGADARRVRRGRLLSHRRCDALRRSRPIRTQGLDFDGRIAEDFKLTTGTWVSVGTAARQDQCRRLALRAGRGDHRRTTATEIGALVFPKRRMPRCTDAGERLRPQCSRTRRCAPGARGCSTGSRARRTGSSTRIARARSCSSRRPRSTRGEITDKGSINQRAVLKPRAALVEELYAEPASSRAIAASGKGRK